ncbi:MAG: glucuronate isomerase [Cyclobacteriaceae bacterium]
MKPFLDQDFLLENSTAKKLYHDFASKMPIIDYHCHLSPKDIAEDRVYQNITEAWLEGDHYKWRAMRANGVDESFITGKANPKEKFIKWADTVPNTFRNPLFHWTHLELQRYFGIHELLSPSSAEEIYETTSTQLKTKEYSCRGLLHKMNVRMVGTTDDPSDDLRYHKQLRDEGFEVKVLPTFRPDKLYAVENQEVYREYVHSLGMIVGFEIKSLDDLLAASQSRIDYFHDAGCRISDHGLDQLYQNAYSLQKASEIFEASMQGQAITQREVEVFKMTMMVELAKMYHHKGWAQQYHLGVIRNNNTRLLSELGPDTGFDSIGDLSQASALGEFLNRLDSSNQLSKTIVYNLNPADNEAFATMLGNFNDGTIAGKMQYGSGWWFLDQKEGMIRQMNTLSNMGLLSQFVGMLTDSRSLLSFPRHEYFRRILCNLIGADVEKGEFPNDVEWLGKHVENISYYNAERYFGF